MAIAAAGIPNGRPVRVMVVDDSVVVRGLIGRWVGEVEGFEVVGTAPNGRVALDLLAQAAPDIMLLDLDMPEIDGVTALPLLLRQRPDLSVFVVSTLTQRNAEIALRCMALGAMDYLPKPSTPREITLSSDFRQELIVKLHGVAARHRRGGVPPIFPHPARPTGAQLLHRPRALVIGASTGGPSAVGEVMRGLRRVSEQVPILIVQHMPAIFTTVFAQQLKAGSGLDVSEGRDGERLEAGRVYVAPGGRHMGIGLVAGHTAVRIDDGPPIRYCRPALDVLFGDAAAVYGGGTVAVVLTGMGSDGLDGARALTRTGATVLVQDEPTSVVWGMPGSVAKAGLAAAILPLARISAAVTRLVIDDPLGTSLRGHG